MSSISDIVPSPCINICTVKDDHCEGCGRSLIEITQWRHMTNKEKQKILSRVQGLGTKKHLDEI